MNEELKNLIALEERLSQMFDSDIRIALSILEELREIKKRIKNK